MSWDSDCLTNVKYPKSFALVEPMEQEELLKRFTEQHAKEILVQMQPDDRTQLFDELPAHVVEKLLKLLLRQNARKPMNF